MHGVHFANKWVLSSSQQRVLHSWGHAVLVRQFQDSRGENKHWKANNEIWWTTGSKRPIRGKWVVYNVVGVSSLESPPFLTLDTPNLHVSVLISRVNASVRFISENKMNILLALCIARWAISECNPFRIVREMPHDYFSELLPWIMKCWNSVVGTRLVSLWPAAAHIDILWQCREKNGYMTAIIAHLMECAGEPDPGMTPGWWSIYVEDIGPTITESIESSM